MYYKRQTAWIWRWDLHTKILTLELDSWVFDKNALTILCLLCFFYKYFYNYPILSIYMIYILKPFLHSSMHKMELKKIIFDPDAKCNYTTGASLSVLNAGCLGERGASAHENCSLPAYASSPYARALATFSSSYAPINKRSSTMSKFWGSASVWARVPEHLFNVALSYTLHKRNSVTVLFIEAKVVQSCI